jgi:hypothetical protein
MHVDEKSARQTETSNQYHHGGGQQWKFQKQPMLTGDLRERTGGS